jgi:hypothetical protein
MSYLKAKRVTKEIRNNVKNERREYCNEPVFRQENYKTDGAEREKDMLPKTIGHGEGAY